MTISLNVAHADESMSEISVKQFFLWTGKVLVQLYFTNLQFNVVFKQMS